MPARPIVMISGASGYLGQHLLSYLKRMERDLELHAAYGSLETFPSDFGNQVTCHMIDISSKADVERLLENVQPTVLVHLAALSSPAVCEKDPDRATNTNCPVHLIKSLPDNVAIILLSTDQVYDGEGAPYTEASSAAPVNVYGKSKLACEELVRTAAPTCSVCLRSSLIIGPETPGRCSKQSFLQFCDERMARGTTTNIFSDEVRSAVFVMDVVRMIDWLVQGGARSHPGVYNMGGPEGLTRLQIAQAVAALRGYDAARLLVPVARASVPNMPFPSPRDISMDSRMLEALSPVQLTSLEEAVRASFC